MFRKIPYTPREREVIGSRPGLRGVGTVNIYNTPATPRENFHAAFEERRPFWMPDINEAVVEHPEIYNARLGRGSRADMTDVFGIRWRYVPAAGGSIVEPGTPLLDNVNNWRKVIHLPDIDAWDWDAAAKETVVDPRFPCYLSFVNGFWFERLISFMDFMPAAMALIDDEQTDAVKDLFAAMTDLGCRLVDKVCETWPMMDFIEVHDDWGAQKAPFFSMDVAYELFVPFMKQLTDRIHAWGRHTMLHSCGHNEERVQCYIDGGFDLWAPQTMNDIGALYDNYGDRIILCVFPEETDLAARSEDEQRAAARRFVDRYCRPGKVAVMGKEVMKRGTPAFLDEVYTCSRAHYLAQNG